MTDEKPAHVASLGAIKKAKKKPFNLEVAENTGDQNAEKEDVRKGAGGIDSDDFGKKKKKKKKSKKRCDVEGSLSANTSDRMAERNDEGARNERSEHDLGHNAPVETKQPTEVEDHIEGAGKEIEELMEGGNPNEVAGLEIQTHGTVSFAPVAPPSSPVFSDTVSLADLAAPPNSPTIIPVPDLIEVTTRIMNQISRQFNSLGRRNQLVAEVYEKLISVERLLSTQNNIFDPNEP